MNPNDDILLRLRGVPAQKGDWKDKYDPRNPQKIAANDSAPICDPVCDTHNSEQLEAMSGPRVE